MRVLGLNAKEGLMEKLGLKEQEASIVLYNAKMIMLDIVSRCAKSLSQLFKCYEYRRRCACVYRMDRWRFC